MDSKEEFRQKVMNKLIDKCHDRGLTEYQTAKVVDKALKMIKWTIRGIAVGGLLIGLDLPVDEVIANLPIEDLWQKY